MQLREVNIRGRVQERQGEDSDGVVYGIGGYESFGNGQKCKEDEFDESERSYPLSIVALGIVYIS